LPNALLALDGDVQKGFADIDPGTDEAHGDLR
jgi:hypothetical protein